MKKPKTCTVPCDQIKPIVIFNRGDRVRHPFSGTGIVIKSKGTNTKVLYDDGQIGTGTTYDYKKL